MSIRTSAGGTMITGAGIPLVRLLVMRSAIQMEEKSNGRMRMTRRSVANPTRDILFELTGEQNARATSKNRKRALKLLEDAIAKASLANQHEQQREDDVASLPRN